MSLRFNIGSADLSAVQEATHHYKFESPGDFFRMCARTLVEHYQRRDKLTAPFRFEAISPEKEARHAKTL